MYGCRLCMGVNIFICINCCHFLLLKYAFYYHNESRRLKMCQNLPREPCFETLIKGSQSQVMVISHSYMKHFDKTWVTAISTRCFSKNAYHTSCYMLLMITWHNSMAFCFVQGLTHRQTAPLKRAQKRRQSTKRNTATKKKSESTNDTKTLDSAL